MSDDSLIDQTETDKRKKMSLIIAGPLLALQVLFLITFFSYLDLAHLAYILLYALVTLMVFFSLRSARMIPVMLGIILAAGLLYVELVKVKWNERYLQNLTTVNAFLLEDYIEEFPTLEEHYFAKTLRKQDWVRLSEYCIEPALKQQPVQSFCRDPGLIQQYYRINIQAELEKFLARMQKTARDIESGRIRTGGQYQTCIAEKRCAPIPLLPEGVDAEALANDTTQHVDVRRAFWDLVEGDGLTPPVCQAMVLCRAMMMIGVVSYGGPVPQSPAGAE